MPEAIAFIMKIFGFFSHLSPKGFFVLFVIKVIARVTGRERDPVVS